ncbi:contactin-associated protein-like 5 isoform X2 [Stegostoma tigrinum]|uniref:contactin-associated protein-like 5 isoform X2 n=1 Tax=Stegostoma tigrinum TaxID=3053191 RepID=UPI00287062E8|nr:contactin-associated protein-like 5 isoform X2 [Stegostoma tigrinum]
MNSDASNKRLSFSLSFISLWIFLTTAQSSLEGTAMHEQTFTARTDHIQFSSDVYPRFIPYPDDCDDHLVSDLPQLVFDSSSELSNSHSPGFAKLNRRDGAGGWSPLESNKHQWLQIDLGERTEITAIATQGRYGSSDWVISYLLMFSDTGRNWKQYRQEDSIWAFTGNANADGVVRHKLQYSIKARLLRFVPLEWNPHGRIGMRVEVYGCSYKSDVADFDGRSSLLYRFHQKSMSTVKDIISLKFKTMQSNGVMLHGEGQRGDRITLELMKGKLSLQINLGDTKLHSINSHTSVTLGSLLDDQHWHSITIERYNKQVNFTVDKHTHHFRTKGEFDYLDIDYELSFGGIPVPGKSASFRRKNFHGCIENLYYNGVNIIDLAKRHKPQIHIMGNVTFSCSEAHIIPVTFMSSSSYLLLPGTPQMDGLSVSFEFRTWNKDGLLLHNELHEASGTLQIHLSDGKLKITILKLSRTQTDIATGKHLNDGQWHCIHFNARRNHVSITLDNDAASTVHSTVQINSGNSYYFGGCPETVRNAGCSNPFGAFHGCMRLIFIDNQPADLILVQQGLLGNFSDLQIDLCGIVDRCLPNYCEHGGECSQSWSTFYCNCSGTGYKRATCHNSVHEQSCEAYKHTGNTSGFFFIDPDGSGPVGPLLVYCNMTEDKTWTVIQHNNTELTKVRGSSAEKPYLVQLNYNASMEQLRAMINSMDYCEQKVAYHCKKSRLLNTPDGVPFTWWIGGTNDKQVYWGGSSPGVQKCACGLEGDCLNTNYDCHCDADNDEWANDTGHLLYKDHLPVTQIVIGDTDRIRSEAAYRIGPLRCYGDRNYWNAASFNTESSYLHFPTFHGELSADISFFFKTTASSGVFLENLGIKDFIRIELNSPTEVVLSFDVGNGPFEVTVKSPTHLNDNQWHYVEAERNIREASLQVDLLPRKAQEAPSDGHIQLQLSSQLFVGGTASRQKGFLGCIRSLRLNGITLDLEERAKITPGVKPGCLGHCSSYGNLCHNGGRCIEKYNGYSCNCSHSAYDGPFCKKEISALFEPGTSLIYTLEESSTTAKNLSDPSSSISSDITLLRENIAFSFRTTHAPCILLYIGSLDEEYLAVTLSRNGSFQVRYKLDSDNNPVFLSIDTRNWANGHVHSVKIDREGQDIYIQIDQFTIVEYTLPSNMDLEFNAVRSLTLGKIVDSDNLDKEIHRANSEGFIGCLSSVQFNGITPLKVALQNSGSPLVSIKGRFVESSCGSALRSEPTAITTSYSLTGVIAIVIFVILCIVAVIGHLLYRHKGTYRTNETKGVEYAENADTTLKNNYQDSISEGKKEYFI